MISKMLCILIMFCGSAFAAECTLYEKTHPLYILTGAHLSTGKCNTCASCHKNGVFNGTPRTCIACHNGDPLRTTIGRSAAHIPTFMVDCGNCHTTIQFPVVTQTQMSHTSVAAYRCDSCHNGAYKAYNAQSKPNDHPKTTLDCGSSGCHKTTTFNK